MILSSYLTYKFILKFLKTDIATRQSFSDSGNNFKMDFVKSVTGDDNQNQGQGQNQNQQGQQEQRTNQQGGGGFLAGLGDKLNSAAGGGRESEKNEDMLDKGSCISFSNSSLLTILQESISFKRSSSAKGHKTTSPLSSKQKMSRSQISFEGNTRILLETRYRSRIKRRDLDEKKGLSFHLMIFPDILIPNSDKGHKLQII